MRGGKFARKRQKIKFNENIQLLVLLDLSWYSYKLVYFVPKKIQHPYLGPQNAFSQNYGSGNVQKSNNPIGLDVMNLRVK